jgi:hypothetical protein
LNKNPDLVGLHSVESLANGFVAPSLVRRDDATYQTRIPHPEIAGCLLVFIEIACCDVTHFPATYEALRATNTGPCDTAAASVSPDGPASRDPKRNQPAEGWLRVALAGKAKEFAQMVLPQPAMPVGQNILLDEKLVKPQPGP